MSEAYRHILEQELDVIDRIESLSHVEADQNNPLSPILSDLLKHYKRLLKQNKKFIKIGDHQQAEIYRINEILEKKNAELTALNNKIKKQNAIIIQQEKLSILGDIVASSTHELSTPLLSLTLGLNMIKRYVHELRSFFDLDSDRTTLLEKEYFVESHRYYPEDLALIFDALEKIRSQMNNMKSFIKFQDAAQDFNVNDELETTISIMNYMLLSNIKVQCDFETGLPLIHGNAALLNQVFFNLIKNATDSKRPGTEALLIIRTYSQKQKIVIEFIDNGKGEDPFLTNNFFHERFSAKSDDKGIDFSLCKEIIEQYNGNISIKNKLGIGTTVKLVLA